MDEASGKSSSKNPVDWVEAQNPAPSRSGERSVIAALGEFLSELSIKTMLLRAGEDYSLICFDASALASAGSPATKLADRPILLFEGSMGRSDVLGALLASSPVLVAKPIYLGIVRTGPKGNQQPELAALQGCAFRRRFELTLSPRIGLPLEVEVCELAEGSLGNAGAIRALKGTKFTHRIGEAPDNLRGREDWFKKRHEKRKPAAERRRSPKQQ